jgi:hypothetical protein
MENPLRFDLMEASMRPIKVMSILVLIAAAAAAGWAQVPPGSQMPDPSRMSEERATELLEYWKNKPERSWSEFIEDWMTPKPFEKQFVVKIDDKYAYPHIVASIRMEIVREDDQYVWLRGIPPEDPKSPLYRVWAQRQVREARLLDQLEASETPGALYFLDFGAEVVPPPFQQSLRFERADGNLPKGGRWQNGFAIADMNEDGVDDLVFPPRRKAYPPQFAVFLGKGDGSFELWKDLETPESLPLDYGGVAVADFDLDGHQDIAIAVHFGSQYVFYGNGKGNFGRVEQLPTPDARVTSRAVTTADFDNDGRPDLAFAAEIDYDLRSSAQIDDATTMWVVTLKEDGWKLQTQGLAQNTIADVIRSADIDRDGRIDLLISSNSVGERRLVYLNQGDGTWKAAPYFGVLSGAYHYNAETLGGEIFSTFAQFKVVDNKSEMRNGLVAYSQAFREQGWRNGRPIVVDAENAGVYFRLALGDLNGDGFTDAVASRKAGGIEVYLQMPDGQFVKEMAPALENTGGAFDIHLRDLDGDGLDDIVAGMAPAGSSPGGVGVWLSRKIDG